jgi:hypothetical protein
LLAKGGRAQNDQRKGKANRGNRAGCGNYSFHWSEFLWSLKLELQSVFKVLNRQDAKYLYGIASLSWLCLQMNDSSFH